jgi:hypothetical protein
MKTSSVRSNSTATSPYIARPTDNDQDSSRKGGVVRTLSRSSAVSTGTITSQRTLADIRTQVAQEVAIRAITKAEVIGDSESVVACLRSLPILCSQGRRCLYVVQERRRAISESSHFDYRAHTPPAGLFVRGTSHRGWVIPRFEWEFADNLWIVGPICPKGGSPHQFQVLRPGPNGSR